MSSMEAAIAVTRFGMGAQAREISSVGGDARGWLAEQLKNPSHAAITSASLKSSQQTGETIANFMSEQRNLATVWWRFKRSYEENARPYASK